jgi:predicted dehydrogenase
MLATASPSKRLRVGFLGTGQFANSFVKAFRRHPGVGELLAADLSVERAEDFTRRHDIVNAGRGIDDLVTAGCDAVAIFTSRQTHGPLAIEALRAGLHVYTAVPAGTTLDELGTLVETCAETRRIFMCGETSYYYPEAIYCREEFRAGRWGKFIHADAQYTHDMHNWGGHFRLTHGDQWKRYAAIPPMFYATHSFSLPLSVTGSHLTQIAAFGHEDPFDDGIYGLGNNEYDNPFSNTMALGQTADGGTVRVGEFRRHGWNAPCGREVSMPQFYCTDVSFECHAMSAILLGRSLGQHVTDHSETYEHDHYRARVVDVQPWVDCPYYSSPDPDDPEAAKKFHGLARAHRPDRLPDAYRGLGSSHNGSHLFLIDDFVRGCIENKLPPCHAWASAAWAAPGPVAHESAIKGGVRLPVPDFGQPPADWPLLEEPARPHEPDRPVFDIHQPQNPPQLIRSA